MDGRGRAALLAAAAVLGAGGCGGGEERESGYREQANAFCADAERRAKGLDEPSTIDDLEPYLRRAIEISRELDRRFRALEPPSALRAQHRRLLRLSRVAERLAEAMADDLAAGRLPQKLLLRGAAELQNLGRESNALAKRMRLPDCVTPLTRAPPPQPS